MSFLHPFTGQQIDRQTAIDVELSAATTYDIIQFKYDGIWGGLFYDPLSQVSITSRNGLTKATKLPIPKFPTRTLVGGEFMYGSQWSKNPERTGKFYAFDLLMLDGEDLTKQPYSVRYAALGGLVTTLNHPLVQKVNSYSAPINAMRTYNSLKQNRAYEGFVCRNWSQTYNENIGRVKLDVEDDFVIMRINEGENRLVGMMGSATVGQYIGDELVEIMDVGGGWDDFTRAAMFKNPAAYYNKVIRVSAKARFDSGAFRHPNFENFREDKSPRECRFTRQSPLLQE